MMVAKLTVRMGNDRLRGLLFGHEKLLLRDPETTDLVPGVTAGRLLLRDALRSLQDAGDEETAALYVAIGADEYLDGLSKGFADAMYNACGRRRDDPRFVRVFPKGQVDVTQPRLWEQDSRMDKYLPEWTKLAKTDKLVADWIQRLGEAHAALKAALGAYKEAGKVTLDATWNERAARLNAAALWDSQIGELMDRFPNDRPRVERYFPRPYKAPDAGDSTAEETPPATPESETDDSDKPA